MGLRPLADTPLPEVWGSSHRLRENKSRERPWRLLFLDTETEVATKDEETEWHRFRLGWTCYIERRRPPRRNSVSWRYHSRSSSVVKEIDGRTKDKATLYVVASNPNFDLWVTKFYHDMYRRGWRATFLIDEGLRFILACQREGRRIVVLASQNFFPVSVGALGVMLGKPKGDTDPLRAPLAEVKSYCRRDVEIIRDSFLQYLDFLDSHDLGAFALTVSGQALRAYRHRFLKTRVWVHKHEKVLALERAAYCGGRCEAYRLGELSPGPFAMMDVNSLYPYVMMTERYPVNIGTWVENPTIERVAAKLGTLGMVADVLIKTDLPLYPLKRDDKLLFPIGEFRTVLCTRSLQEAIRRGHLRHVYRVAAYKMRRLFHDYAKYFLELREHYRDEKNPVWSATCKLLANSLYGKFGQANPKTVKREHTGNPRLSRATYIDDQADRLITVTECMGERWEQAGRVEAKDAMPAIAAHVTDYGRWHLAAAIEKVGWGRVLYCDTDSVIVRMSDSARLGDWIHPSLPGAWKLVKDWRTLHLYGCKDYVGDGLRVLKGVSPLARELDHDTFLDTRFPGLKSLLRVSWREWVSSTIPVLYGEEEKSVTQALGLYPIEHHTKSLSRKYDKGSVDARGRVRPYRLFEEPGAEEVL